MLPDNLGVSHRLRPMAGFFCIRHAEPASEPSPSVHDEPPMGRVIWALLISFIRWPVATSCFLHP